jgi:hypothetical protein
MMMMMMMMMLGLLKLRPRKQGIDEEEGGKKIEQRQCCV